ncbi:MAG: class I SAM-dependent methyltransferase [Deltaproteobacteria bacterium]|nr:class I SAM-dependent methyltransferase [Deltaproteobacteria bacterium]
MIPLREDASCPLCGRFSHPSVVEPVVEKDPYAIVRCAVCGICFASPRPTPAAMAEFYERYFAEDPLAGYEHYREGEAWRARVARHRLALLGRFIAPGRILDHGCATGVFLDEAVNAGWEAYGVEPSSAARSLILRRAPYVKVLPPEDLATLPDGMFDAVTMFDNFCYLHDPIGALREFGRLLRPGGVLLSIGALDHGPAHRAPEPGITHTFYYSPRSVARLCRAAGLRVLMNRTIVKNANNPGKHPFAWLFQEVPWVRNLFFRQHCFVATPEGGA